MEATWFVVADRSGAHVYEVEGSKLHPTLRPLESLQESAPGVVTEAPTESSSHQQMLDPTGAVAEKDRRFVRSLVDHLTQAQRRRAFSRLVIAAPAELVGHIRDISSRTLARSVHREIIGDYTNDTPRALQERVRRRRWLD
ncbi:MAG: host attachment protein [Nannocystaceae bacterium]